MIPEIRVLDGEDDLIAAANLFRTAMVGFPPLPKLAPGRITKLLEPGRTIGAFVEMAQRLKEMGWHATTGLEAGIAATYRDFIESHSGSKAAELHA